MEESEALEGQKVWDRQRSHFRRGGGLHRAIVAVLPTRSLLAQVPGTGKRVGIAPIVLLKLSFFLK